MPTSRKLEQAADRETDGTISPYAHCPGAGWRGTVLSSTDRLKKCPSGGRRVLTWPKVAPRHAGPPQASQCPAQLIPVTDATSPLRSGRSLMLMTVNMEQRP